MRGFEGQSKTSSAAALPSEKGCSVGMQRSVPAELFSQSTKRLKVFSIDFDTEE